MNNKMKENKKLIDMMVPTIFKKNVKNNSKLRPLNEIISDVGEIQYFSAAVRFRESLVWHRLSNSGNALKLLIPSCIRKNICG